MMPPLLMLCKRLSCNGSMYRSLFFYPISFHLKRLSFQVKITTTPILGLGKYLHISLRHLQSGHSCVDLWDWCYTQVGMIQLHCTPHCPRGYYHFHFQSRLHGVVQHLYKSSSTKKNHTVTTWKCLKQTYRQSLKKYTARPNCWLSKQRGYYGCMTILPVLIQRM